MKRKRSDKVGMLYSRIMIIVLCLGFVINALAPDQAESTVENRSLQQFPAWNTEDVISGRYGTELNNWFSDQFVGRNALIHLRYLTLKATGTRKIDDVYLGHHTLVEDVAVENEKQLQRNLKAINAFQKKESDINCTFVLVPNAVYVQPQNLPTGADPADQSERIDAIYDQLNSKVKTVDLRSSLKKYSDDYLYYRTDHHWTSYGAFRSFQTIAKEMDLDQNVKKSDYKVYTVADDFKGTLAHKTGSLNMKDDVEIYVPKNDPDYLMTDPSSHKRSRTVFSSEGAQSEDAYTVFLNGNHARIDLEMDNDSDRHLLLIKDSYANAMIPFLIPYYRTITVVDPRYYTGNLSQLMATNVYTDVLYLYNYNTFVQDTSLADVLNS
ncbi:DHHW family protein [Catenisphaera adipataccumulans]|uniref:AlgX/AlgJ SGNH hydrolase-like domain-containing protein n=1 Tax=Catenisphaera adipataccumulans TaxID=700500 RepID=A0A7W8FX15_9FIRM|nr:DHHW family protein [Catenisphaera adipataccumulans]MBB5183205.1 hypothetical protein [Catenisphaera adipataccumulans]